jgi:hypothetical protein
MKYKKSLIEDTKEVTRSLKSKKYNGQKKKDKRTNNNLRNTTHKTKETKQNVRRQGNRVKIINNLKIGG